MESYTQDTGKKIEVAAEEPHVPQEVRYFIDNLYYGDESDDEKTRIERDFGTMLTRYPEFEKNFDLELARKLMAEHRPMVIIDNLKTFQETDHFQIAKEIIEQDADVVLGNIAQFRGLSDSEKADIAERVMASSRQDKLIWYLDSFPSVPQLEYCETLNKRGLGSLIIQNLEKLASVSRPQIIEALLRKDLYNQEFFNNLEKFNEIEQKRILEALMLRRDFRSQIAESPEKFSRLARTDIAQVLVENAYGDEVMWNIDKFPGVDHNELVMAVLKNLRWDSTFLKNSDTLGKLQGLGMQVAMEMMGDSETRKVLAEKLQSFDPTLHTDILLRMIETERDEVVYRPEYAKIVANIDTFPDIDRRAVAESLLEKGHFATLAKNIEKFPSIDRIEFAQMLLDKEEYFLLANNLDKFPSIDRIEFAQLLFDKKEHLILNDNLEKFLTEDNTKLAQLLFDKKEYFLRGNNLEKFLTEDNTKLAQVLIEKNLSETLTDNLEKFTKNTPDFAEKLLHASPNTEAFVEALSRDGFWQDAMGKLPEAAIGIATLALNLEKNISAIRSVPFLAEALRANPRDAARLVLKVPELDALAKENITELYALKHAAHVAPGDDAVGFRQHMQAGLQTFRRNKEIRAACEEGGMDMDVWLGYAVEREFSLGERKELRLHEVVKAPVDRTSGLLEEYQKSVRAVLGAYKSELSGVRVVTDDIDALREQRRQAEERLGVAEAAGEEKKVAGIRKGIASLDERIKNPKTGPLWEKVLGVVDVAVRAQKDVHALVAELDTLTDESLGAEVATLTPVERRKRIQNMKNARAEKEALLIEKFEVLRRRIDAIQPQLQALLAPALSEERTAAVMQEVIEPLVEYIDHYRADIQTVDMLTKKTDKQENLEGRLMSIKVWDRNPDVDLYVGNYTSCCVAIDNSVHGANSPIADYLTDVGMQVVTITDEKRNRAIAAAWCFPGIDKDGNVAFVIDNIEADTSYSAPYQDQLNRELRTYIEAYAQAARLPRVSQGEPNNDLFVAPLETRYKKLGGYNNPDGYYLEAEVSDDGDDDEEEDEVE